MENLHQIIIPNCETFGIISSTKTKLVKYASLKYAWMVGMLVEEVIEWVYVNEGSITITGKWKEKKVDKKRIN